VVIGAEMAADFWLLPPRARDDVVFTAIVEADAQRGRVLAEYCQDTCSHVATVVTKG